MSKVSVIIPVYNVEKYLRECLDSVIGQTLKDIEIICVNDGSTDGSVAILEEYAARDSRVKVLNQENKGAGEARNTGIVASSGEYLHFMDADDYVFQGAYEKIYKTLEYTNFPDIIRFKASGIDCVTNEVVHNELYEISNFREGFCLNKFFNIKNDIDVITNLCVTPWIGFIKRDFVVKNNLTFNNFKCCNDRSFFIKSVLLAKKLYLADINAVCHRVNNLNSLRGIRDKHFDCHFNSIKTIADFCKTQSIEADITKKVILAELSDLFAFFKEFVAKSKYSYQIFKQTREFILEFDTTKLYPEIKEMRYYKMFNKLKHCSNFALPFVYFNMKYRLLEHIFSIKNVYRPDKAYKVICILGVKLKLRNKKKELMISNDGFYDDRYYRESKSLTEKFCNHKVLEKTALFVEANNCHGECLPGMCKYFLDLGYNIDTLLSTKEIELGSLCCIKSDKVNVFEATPLAAKMIFNNKCVKDYELIYFNSDVIYMNKKSALEYFDNANLDKAKIIQMCHRIENFSKLNTKNLIMLPDFGIPGVKMVNSHYFGDIEKHNKNEVVNFVVIGKIENERKNFSLLLDVVDSFNDSGVKDFKVTVVARTGELKIPDNIQKYFDFKGKLSYPDMYNEIQKSDFFLPMLDPENPEHDRYITTGTSGSFQLIYGFNKPCLIAEKFAKPHHFNGDNSIVYKTNGDFINAMKRAIDMKPEDYNVMQNNLTETTEKIRAKSLQNLKEILNP